jgi:prepilin-type N-terminal cleavage/methylation domain-containing protein
MHKKITELHKTKTVAARAFTLIELLVVIAIIGLLSSIVLAALQTARNKGSDAKRFSDLRSMEQALDAYYQDNGHYPINSSCNNSGTNWCTMCANLGVFVNFSSAATMIPGLTPTYIATIPQDPLYSGAAGDASCYAYTTDAAGKDYKFVDYQPANSSPTTATGPTQAFKDSGGAFTTAWAVWSTNGSGF